MCLWGIKATSTSIALALAFLFGSAPFSNVQRIWSRSLTLMSKMRNSPPVVFYRYEASPASAKIENVLAFKGVPHYRVEVAMTLPRPEITDALGIGYRRIPILAIGNDVFCDTNLIISAVERCFPKNQGFPTLFPDRKDGGKGDTGIIELLAAFYVDRPLFSLATTALPYDKFSPEFIEDRSKWFGTPMDIQKMVARKPVVMGLLSSHMNYLEKQLSDGREWVFDTATVGYADLDLYHVFGWIMRFRGMKQVITPEKFPRSIAWMQRMAEFEKAKREANAPGVTKIDGSAAAKIIADNADERLSKVGFDQDEAKLLGLKLGEKVQVIPDDNSTNYPTIGDLAGFTREEMVLRLKGTAVPSLYCHFPRLNYTVTPVAPTSSKL